MRYLATIWCLCAGPVLAAGPAEAAAVAARDRGLLPPQVAVQTAYLWTGAVPVEQRRELRQAVAFWANSGSTEAEPIQPRSVSGEVLAIYLPDYGDKLAVWQKFVEADPYFTATIRVPWQGGVWPGDGRHYAAGSFHVTKTVSRYPGGAPIVRADWWAAQVAVQDGRQGTGYYDWIGVGKKRADFEKLVGLDRAAAVRLKKEVQAIVDDSVVALHNRQIVRFQTLAGAYWETRDSKVSVGKNNALRLLNGDLVHDAEEVYGTLPNGLFAFFLADAAGNRAATAPDDIASDGRSVSTDRRVHVGLSCVRCHVEGIRPINCWFRRAYAAPDGLAVADPARALRLRQLYLSDLDRLVARDQADYAAALKLTNGLTPGDNAKVVASVWEAYNDRLVTLDDLAREMNVDPAMLGDAIRMKPGIDPVLFSVGKGIPARREHIEEVYGLALELMGGGR